MTNSRFTITSMIQIHSFHLVAFSCMHTIYNLLNFDIYTSVKPYNLLLIRILRTILIIPDADIITQVGFQDFNIYQSTWSMIM